MTFGLSLVALAIAAATATFVLIIREIHIRALDMRVSKAVMGVPGQSAPLQDMTGWFSSLGERYQRSVRRHPRRPPGGNIACQQCHSRKKRSHHDKRDRIEWADAKQQHFR